MTVKTLTEQKKLWARYYVVDFNATKAAVSAGYAVSGANTRGYELSHDPLTLAYVYELTQRINKRIDVDADYIRARLAEIDQLDLGDLLGDDGRVLPIKEWPKSWRISISGVDFGDLVQASSDPDDTRMIQMLKKIKWPDKSKNLELLGRHIDVGAWQRDPEAHKGDPEPMTINFKVSKAKADVKVTNAKA